MKRLFIYIIGVFLAGFVSCSKKELVSHYERPDWLKGNAWEVLEGRGNFTQFLKGVERAGFREVLDGKTITTIFAPTDDAFLQYLSKNSATDIDQLPLRQLKKLIGYHLIYYSYDKLKLQDYQPKGSDNVEPNLAGLYYKHRSRSQDSISLELDKSDGKTKKVYHKDRFVPVLSNIHFQTKGIDATSNYEYFFGAGSWKGSGGFNVANAAVSEYAIPADNGYVYVIDQVLQPLQTVYETLNANAEYRDFLGVYDRYRTFTYDEQTSANYAAVGDSLFNVSHGILPSIASEWTTFGFTGSYDYFDLAGLTYRAFNVFAPSNQALQAFFNTYFSPYYKSLHDVDLLPLAMLMYNHVYTGSVVFPSEIGKNPDIKTSFGSPIVFDPQADVKSKALASNGAFYGLDRVLVPQMFNSVTGPAFRNPKYKMFMYMLYKSGLYQTLASENIDFTLFIPSDEVILNTLYADSYMFWTEGNPLIFGDESVLILNTDGVYVELSQRQQELFVSDHIAYGKITSLQGTDVYRTRNNYSYLYVRNGKVYSTAAFNTGEGVNVTNISGNWYNGSSYETAVSLIGETGTIKFTLLGAETASNPLNKYAEFSKLLAKAGLMVTGNSLSFLFGNRFLLFAPDNQTVLDGLSNGSIPTDNAALAEYLKSYFVSVPDNSLGDYPFPGFGVQGTWNTALRTGYNEYRQLTLTDNGTNLTIKDKDDTVIPVQSVLPQVFADGAVYQISTLLKK
ncbi:fasciclin domain-containing protein [Sphingobacterium sp. LRF_L2]|uniref:fasciclin domain-containing protein n=1 Tax=Sphingobacterium sp. LRF_L2 TaxID=3369421 RepID=UPI003F5F5BDC